ncbi:MAG: polysaccharide deacetylase family protein [Bacteriovoracaceae bacterium]|jgi:peptidoglycan/xylan/chitin deacetylase (PgdA/CDA1 family)|nr:polysaccharide deacetylase family protein [Bacteriovoracaceae bacterium]
MRNTIVDTIIKALYFLGPLKWYLGLKNYFSPRKYILMFHRVTDGSSHGMKAISISNENFISTIETISGHGDKIVAIEEIDNFKAKRDLDFHLTFDDAYKAILDRALPYCDQREIPYSLFPVTNFLENPKPYWWDIWDTALELGEYQILNFSFFEYFPNAELTIDQNFSHLDYNTLKSLDGVTREEMSCHILDKLKKKHVGIDIDQSFGWNELEKVVGDNVHIGCHTSSHQFLPYMDHDQTLSDINQSISKLETFTGVDLKSFAFPAGLYDQASIRAVNCFDFSYKFSTECKSFTENDQNEDRLIPRFNINDEFVCDKKGRFSPAYFYWNLIRRDQHG